MLNKPRHFLLLKMKRIDIPNDMTESAIFVQLFANRLRNDGGTDAKNLVSHLPQERVMPPFSHRNSMINHRRD